jgi:hypothetical protein
MAISTVTHGRVEIDFDLSRPENQTVLQGDLRIDGKPALDSVVAARATAGGNVGQTLRMIEHALSDAWSAVSKVQATAPSTFAFRDAADRVHETLVSPIWVDLTVSRQDQAAFGVAARALELVFDWEAAAPQGTPRYIHKGTLFFYAAVSSLRLRNVDRGLLFLEAGEDCDRKTYLIGGQPGGEVTRPGTLTLLLDPQPANALYNDVLALRAAVDQRLGDFRVTGGEPPADALVMTDFDSYFLRDPSTRSGGKFCVGYMYWKQFNVDDPVIDRVARSGELTRRRQAELLFGVLTASEELVRRVEGTMRQSDGFRGVVAAVVARDWTGMSPTSVEKVLQQTEALHSNDIDKCLKFWQSQLPPNLPPGSPWYLRWIEQGRFVRNRIAHSLDTPAPVETRWSELDRVAWFYLFTALWLTRQADASRKRPPPTNPVPIAGPPTISQNSGLPQVMPSGAIGLPSLVT